MKKPQIFGWLFTLFLSIIISKSGNLKVNDQRMIHALNRYIDKALLLKWNLDDVKNDVMQLINESDGHENLFDTPNLKQYKNELTELVEAINNNPVQLDIEDFDARINLNLSSTHGYYRAKQILMKHYIENDTDQITTEKMEEIINKSQKYKFYLSLQNKEMLDKLMTDISTEVNNYYTIYSNFRINSIFIPSHCFNIKRHNTCRMGTA